MPNTSKQKSAPHKPTTTKKRRGRIKSPVKRQIILDAASETFISRGFDKTSMDAIAERAGVSKQTVYSHFGSKEELFTAVVKDRSQTYVVNEQPIFDNRNCREYLVDFAIDYQRIINSPDVIAMYRLCGSTSEQINLNERFWHAGPEQTLSHLKQYFKEQTALGNLKIPNPDIAAVQLTSLLAGDAHSMSLLGINADRAQSTARKYAESCVELFISFYEK